MPVDAILIIRVRVCEIIGQARDGRKFKACGGIEIGITESVVPGRVPIALDHNAVRIIVPDGNSAPAIDHEIVHTLIPLQ
jgi:hypothetical protein